MLQITPAVLAKSKEEFLEKIQNPFLRSINLTWQVDVLDGSLFKSTSWHAPEELPSNIKNTLPEIELHLMIQNPMPEISKWIKHVPSTKKAIIHAEIAQELPALIQEIKHMGIQVGIAINPETPIQKIEHLIPHIDTLLIMGVHPGASGQTFLGEPILQKIREAKAKFEQLWVSVDGGVNTETIQEIKKAGVNQICSGSALFRAEKTEHLFSSFLVDN